MFIFLSYYPARFFSSVLSNWKILKPLFHVFFCLFSWKEECPPPRCLAPCPATSPPPFHPSLLFTGINYCFLVPSSNRFTDKIYRSETYRANTIRGLNPTALKLLWPEPISCIKPSRPQYITYVKQNFRCCYITPTGGSWNEYTRK